MTGVLWCSGRGCGLDQTLAIVWVSMLVLTLVLTGERL